MAEERKERCETCRWWDRADKGSLYPAESEVGAHLSETHEGLDVGECRRFPPAVSDEQARRVLRIGIYRPDVYDCLPLGVLNAATVWPHTAEWDWCGEWRAKPEGNGNG